MSPWVFLVIGCLVHLQHCSGELRLVQTVFRHGDRAPLKSYPVYPKDRYINETYEPMGHGGLTNKGKMTSFTLGKFFRHKYGSFLGDVYKKDIVSFQADEVERVIMTVQLVAAALFPPTKQQQWHPGFNWQPIPVWYKPFKQDYLYNGMFCTNYKKWRHHVENNNREVLKWYKDHASLFAYLSEHAGYNITQRGSFFIRQQLQAQMDLGLQLPEWSKPIFPGGILEEVAAFDVVIQSYTAEMQQLLAGTWLQEWLNHVEDHLNRKDPRKAFMYGAHELNIGGLLVALRNYNYRLPSYKAAMMFELHELHGKYFVQIHHHDEGVDRILLIPGCNADMCPLETFKRAVAHIIPKDVKGLCGELCK